MQILHSLFQFFKKTCYISFCKLELSVHVTCPWKYSSISREREMVAEWLGHISHGKCVPDVTLAAGCLLQVIAPTPFATFQLFIYRNKDQQLFLGNMLCN